jgi:hypothetical protein
MDNPALRPVIHIRQPDPAGVVLAKTADHSAWGHQPPIELAAERLRAVRLSRVPTVPGSLGAARGA